MTTTTQHVHFEETGPVDVTFTTHGSGRPLVLLHGGAGPQSVAGFAERLAASGDFQVLVPIHPGFEGTPRPDTLTTISGLARLYVALLDELDLAGVTVVGNSIGGWIAAEIALLDAARVAGVVLLDAVGLDLPQAPIADFFSLTMDQVVDLSYANPDAFRFDPAKLPPARQVAMAGNRETLRVYGGTTMADPTLLGRLPAASTPVLVVWGAADGIVRPEHGTAYVDALPDARFVLIADAGHLPQLETPEMVRDLVVEFAAVETAKKA
ncbi:pimeloyl-ACP methyl ester carboxylesterase [Kibdelosporangium banguiense]|uniref:Pimeloyl-ACP methyl ester carboxylesterase n=1 Tax=Kibdelosporangium banguiense TaxID=1365924 RepID=A0ABS4TV16_9PSEU|nr:alpha/beta hydrolase [Kibdelosporangium banguiense]MBP2328252.1 pimeloyl-ACP methyl ester carboxylesterase [Kibdelosporangium banguiense]